MYKALSLLPKTSSKIRSLVTFTVSAHRTRYSPTVYLATHFDGIEGCTWLSNCSDDIMRFQRIPIHQCISQCLQERRLAHAEARIQKLNPNLPVAHRNARGLKYLNLPLTASQGGHVSRKLQSEQEFELGRLDVFTSTTRG